jgi:hypothetical protein
MANIVAKGVVMKEKPNLVSHNLKFSVSMVELSFIDLCDYSNENEPSFPNVVVLICMIIWVVEEQPLHLDVSQVAPFTNIIDSLKVMPITSTFVLNWSPLTMMPSQLSL